MDWLVLIVVVPLILIPIVVLCGFAGCGTLLGISDDVASTSGLVAKGTDTQRIDLTWSDNSGGTIGSTVERAEIGTGFAAVGGGISSFSSGGLDEGKTYLFRLTQSGTLVSDVATATTFPTAPQILDAIGVDLDSIRIRWKNTSARADGFILQHRLVPAGSPAGAFSEIPVGGLTEFTHTGLAAGSAHEYQVIATVDGFDSNFPKQVRSAPSAPIVASALQWRTCYPTRQPTRQQSDVNLLKGHCLVQRFNAGVNLQHGGIKVRITLRAASGGDIAIIAMSISPAAVPGVALPGNPSPKEWDSAANPTAVPLVGTPPASPLAGFPGGILLTAGSTITLNPVAYSLDATKDLLVAFDFGLAAGAGVSAAVVGCNVFHRANTAEAMLWPTPRAIDYLKGPDSVYFVEQIDVLG